MEPDKLEQYRIDAFLDALKRSRWFLMATILVSTLILSHTYLRLFCYREKLLVNAIAGTSDGDLSSLLTRAKHQLQRDRGTQSEGEAAVIGRLRSDAREILNRVRQVNTLKDLKSLDRPLWVLPFIVPDDDFLPLMGMMLAVLSTALWLCVRSMLAPLEACNRDLKEVAYLNLLFPVSAKTSGQDRWAKYVQHLCVWSPAVIFTAAVCEDFASAPGTDWGHTGLLFFLLVPLWATAWASKARIQEMDTHMAKYCTRT